MPSQADRAATLRHKAERLKRRAARELHHAEAVRAEAESEATRILAEAQADAARIRESAYNDAMLMRSRLLTEFGQFAARLHEESTRVLTAFDTKVDRLLGTTPMAEALASSPTGATGSPMTASPASAEPVDQPRTDIRPDPVVVHTVDARPPVDLEGLFGPEPPTLAATATRPTGTPAVSNSRRTSRLRRARAATT